MRELARAIRFTLSLVWLVLRVARRGGFPAARRIFGMAGALSPLLAPFVFAPLAGLVVGWAIGGRGFGFVGFVALLVVSVALMADTGKGLSLEHLDEQVRGAVQQSRRNLAALRVRRGWDETCHALGWDTTAAELGSNGAPRLIRRPALQHVQALGDRMLLAFRPRADQGPKMWAELVEGLRRHLGMHSADFFEHPGEPGTLVATFGPEPLPVVHRPVGEAGRRRAASPEADLRIPLGPRAGGGDAAWVPAESPHLLLAGGTGGGKGGTLRVIVRDLLAAGALVKVCDPKGTGEWRWAAESGAVVAHDLEGIVRVLRDARDEIASRCAVLWQLGADKMADVALEHRLPAVFVVLDEAADVLMLRRVPTEKANDDLRSEAGSLAAIIASQGRAADVHLAVAIQRADIQLLGPAGGFLRDNLSGRIGLGRLTGEGLDMLFGTGHRDRLAALTGRPGRALAMALAVGETEPYGVQVEHVTSEDVRTEVPAMAMNGGSGDR
jgi:hypothetical protein